MRASHILGNTLAVSLLVTSFFGCSKESKAPEVKAQGLLNSPLLAKLPTSTAGFLVFDLSGEGYKNLQASPWGKSMSGLGSLKETISQMEASGAGEAEVKLAETALAALQKLGLLAEDGSSTAEKVISQGVWFFGPATGELPLEAGLFASAAPSSNLAQKLPILKSSLTEAGLTVTEEQVAGTSGLKVTPPDSETPAANLFIAATEKEFGMALTKSALETLLGSNTTQTIDTLKALPEFKKAEAAVQSSEAPVTFGFVSVPRLMPLLAQAKDEDFNPAELPVDSLGFSAGFSRYYAQQFAAVVSPKTESQKKIISAMEGSTVPAAALGLPRDAAFSLAFNTSVLTKLEDVSKSLEESGMANPGLIKEIRGLVLGVRHNNSGSPLPDLFIALETDKADEIGKSLEGIFSLGLMAAGQEAQWASKEIAGNPTRYFNTLIGAGVYMTAAKSSKNLLIGTSEKAMEDLLASTADSAKGIQGGLSDALKARIPTRGIGLFYINFPQVANLMDGVKGSLGMLAGGTGDFDKAFDPARIRTLGVSLGDMSYADGVFKVESAIDTAAK